MGLARCHRRDASAMKAPMCHSDIRAMRFVSNGVPSVLAAMLVLGGASRSLASEPLYLSPGSLLADRPGQNLFVACTTANRVLVVNLADRQVTRTFPMPGPPSGLALSADGHSLFVTCAAPESTVCVVNTSSGQVERSIPAGHTATAPVFSPDGRTLFVCHRFSDEVAFIDLPTGQITRRVRVAREPVAAVLTPDGRHLLVANLLHNGRADTEDVAAVISVVDVSAARVVKELRLPPGAGLLNDICISPDGRFAAVTHLVARFQLPTTQIERGWMNANALTLIDLVTLEIINTVLLDSVDRGAANPWGLAWSAADQKLVIAHAGTHELSVIDFPGLLKKLAALPAPGTAGYGGASSNRSEVPNDLAFLANVRRRVPLAAGDWGPRAVVVVDRRVWTANYFSDTLSLLDLSVPERPAESVALGVKAGMTSMRRGEFLFHSADICFQGWQSCASCHPGEARVDALNWDLLNDGLGNPKNNRSLLYTHRIAPAMSLGVRPTAEAAVRAGIRHILFTVQPEPVAEAIDEYLKSLRPVPSPRLVRGRLSPAAQRGEALFHDARTGCAECHPPGLFTDMKRYDVGTRGAFDRAADTFFTPTLIEVWRTAPYLHDGSAATMLDVLKSRNPGDSHGRTSRLSPEQMDDLAEYVLSL